MKIDQYPKISGADILPGMAFRVDDDDPIHHTPYRCVAIDNGSIRTGEDFSFHADSRLPARLLSTDPEPKRPEIDRVPLGSLPEGAWFDYKSPYGFAARRIITRDGDHFHAWGLSRNWVESVSRVGIDDPDMMVYPLPEPVFLDSPRVVLAGNQWSLISDDNWRKLQIVSQYAVGTGWQTGPLPAVEFGKVLQIDFGDGEPPERYRQHTCDFRRDGWWMGPVCRMPGMVAGKRWRLVEDADNPGGADLARKHLVAKVSALLPNLSADSLPEFQRRVADLSECVLARAATHT